MKLVSDTYRGLRVWHQSDPISKPMGTVKGTDGDSTALVLWDSGTEEWVPLRKTFTYGQRDLSRLS